jgi:hypothetical protein
MKYIEFRMYFDDVINNEELLEFGEEFKDMLYNAEPEVVDVTYEIKKGDIKDDKP